MKNLKRALWMTLKYRWSMVGSFVCCLCVAVLWGANLGAVYPFLEVVLKDKTIPQWVELRDQEATALIQKHRSEIQSLQASADPDDQATRVKIGRLESNIKSEQEKLAWSQELRPYVEKYAPKTSFETLAWILGLMVAGTVLRGLFLMGNMVAVARISQRTVLDLQNQAFRNVIRMEPNEAEVKGTGDLVGRIRGETSVIGMGISVLYGKTVREPLKMVACLIGAAYWNWRLLLLSCLICPIAGYLMVLLAKITKQVNKRAMEESAKLMNRLYQAMTYQRVVKAFSMEEGEQQRFENVANDVYHKGIKIAFFSSIARVNNELLGVSMIALSILVGGYLILSGQTHLFGYIQMSNSVMSFAELITFFAFLVGIADPLRKMADVYNTLQTSVVAADRVFPLIDQLPAVQNPTAVVPLPEGELQIEFKDLNFEYETDKPVLKDLSVVIPAGASVAMIGHNGCGKSTLINLVPRFFDVTDGSVLVGGVDVRQCALDDLRGRIGYVTQQTMLFDDSIADNIAYGQQDVDRDAVVDAAKKAYAHDFIQSMQYQYDTNIGEHGGKLSGGQRQRIALARAILKDPDILILDEATSQIDIESETLIHEALAKFIKNRTTLIVTHRISTLDLVDYIVFMTDGKVTDFGTHEQLLARCPEYRQLRSVAMEDAA